MQTRAARVSQSAARPLDRAGVLVRLFSAADFPALPEVVEDGAQGVDHVARGLAAVVAEAVLRVEGVVRVAGAVLVLDVAVVAVVRIVGVDAESATDPITGKDCKWNVFRVCNTTTMDTAAITPELVKRFGKKWFFVTLAPCTWPSFVRAVYCDLRPSCL